VNQAGIDRFVEHWCENWNNHDLDGIVGHFSEDATFTSPKAAQFTGSATLKGKNALRAYWGAAIQRATSRVFTPERTVWDPEKNELVLVYISNVDGYRRRAVEFFRFNERREVTSGEAMYGADL
jgi:ketosteroid isomerase-like protein